MCPMAGSYLFLRTQGGIPVKFVVTNNLKSDLSHDLRKPLPFPKRVQPICRNKSKGQSEVGFLASRVLPFAKSTELSEAIDKLNDTMTKQGTNRSHWYGNLVNDGLLPEFIRNPSDLSDAIHYDMQGEPGDDGDGEPMDVETRSEKPKRDSCNLLPACVSDRESRKRTKKRRVEATSGGDKDGSESPSPNRGKGKDDPADKISDDEEEKEKESEDDKSGGKKKVLGYLSLNCIAIF